LANAIFGGHRYADWERPSWEHGLSGGLRMLRMSVDTHLITSDHPLPLMLSTSQATGSTGLLVEMIDRTAEFDANFREGVGFYYDLVKASSSGS
jgi:hypothetical protein